MSRVFVCLVAVMLWSVAAQAAPDARLVLPDFAGLEKKATDTVSITLDAGLLSLASGFMNSNDPKDATTQQIIKGLRGIYVRSFTFDHDFVYQASDLEAVRKQLEAPGWNRLVQTRSKKTHEDVDIYVMVENQQAIGLALISSEPRELTIVNIVGAIDLEKLRKLEGQFGVPKLDFDSAASAAGDKQH
jgi:hypothetical protein